ncbi:MAG: phage major capsid protein, partial [Albidovulum sp.]|uniref:phage major capsid protein n=1 Tax=Albidovulum sp. TaxID=1872424 RepID=UPI003C957B43
MFIEDKDDLEARKQCMTLFRDLNIKSLTDIRAHELPWAKLCDVEKRLNKAARDLLDNLDDNPATDQSTKTESAIDALTGARNAMVYEKDQRTELGSKEPRAHGGSAKRPGLDAVTVQNGGGEDAREVAFALAPEQRFTSWAQARSTRDEYGGLSLGGYLRSMVVGAKTDVERRALAEGTDSAGGYTVPTDLSARLIDLLRGASVVTQAGAQTVPLTSDTNVIAKLASDPVPAWRAENASVAESDPTFSAITLAPKSLAVFTKVSLELMQDSINLEAQLPVILAAAMAQELDRVALLGSGTAPEPTGIANTAGIGTTAVGAALTGYGNLLTARTGILTANAGPISAIILHPRDEGTLSGLTDTTGQPLMAPKVIADTPMLTTTKIAVDGGVGTDESTIFAGNFRHLLIGIRQDIRVELIKTTTYASNLQYTLIAHMRADV